MQAYDLKHITDLHLLSDGDVVNFARELPSIVASLKIAAKANEGSGVDLNQVFPSMKYVPEMEKHHFRGGGKVISLTPEEALVLQNAQQTIDQVMEQMKNPKAKIIKP